MTTQIILELNKPYSLNLGEDFIFVENYYKGRESFHIENLRPKFKGVKTGKEVLFLLEPYDNFLGYRISVLDLADCTYSPLHKKYKNKVYNYYFLNNDVNLVHNFFRCWKDSNPLIHVGGFVHQKLNLISNYTYVYRFDNKTY